MIVQWARQSLDAQIAGLFANGEQGAIYKIRPQYVYQANDTSTPGAVDSRVGYVSDRSPNSNHILQATDSSRPFLRQTAGGLYRLEFDGVDDFLKSVFAIGPPVDRISAFQMISARNNGAIYHGGSSVSSVLGLSGVTNTLVLYDGSAAVANNADAAFGADVVATERHNGASSRLAINNGAYTTGDPGTNNSNGITIGASNSGSGPSQIYFYGGVMINRALTDPEIALCRRYFGAEAGLSL